MKKIIVGAVLLLGSLVFGQNMDSREGDSLALVAIKKANPGSALVKLWNETQPITSWTNVLMNYSTMRVTQLYILRTEDMVDSLPPEIGNLKKLEILNIRYSSIKALPTELKHASNITQLFINGKMAQFPDVVCEMPTLLALSLQGNSFNEVPLSINNLKKLSYLDLSNNKLSAYPKSIESLPVLTDLNLSGNQITSIPSPFINPFLVKLSLSNNQIKEVPVDILHMQYLRRLDLSFNMIDSLPKSQKYYYGLACLILNNNRIKSFSSPWNQLTSGQFDTLILSNNEIITLNLGALKAEEFLDLSHNLLEELPYDFWDNYNLEALDLSNNKISQIAYTISKSSRLNRLSLAHNLLSNLPKEVSALKSLDTLDLSSNLFTNFSFDILPQKRIDRLKLANNQLTNLDEPSNSSMDFSYLDLSNNMFETLPDWLQYIDVRIGGDGLDIGYNFLQESNLSNDIVSWLNDYDYDWETTQKDPSPIVSTPITKTVPLTASISGRTLTLSQALPTGTSLSLYDLSGRKIISGEVTGSSFAIPNLAKGIYVAEILAGKHSVVQKVVVR